MRTIAASFTALSFALTGLVLPAQAEQVASSKSTGLILMDEADYDALPERDPLMRGRLPQFVDLSSFFPPPGHQGAQGSCVGWAVGYALKTYQEALEFNIAQPQAWDHFSPAFVFNSIKQGNDCAAGSRISDALEFVANTGAVRMDDFPYEEAQCLPPSEDMSSIARDYAIKSYRRLQKDGMLFAIREALSNEKPVVIAMRVFPSFEEWDGGSNYRHDPDVEFQVDYHAVTVVGYDDERRALKIINSWGTEWGDDGFFWMDYRAARQLIAEAYVTTDRLFDEPYPEEETLVLAMDSDMPRGTAAASGAPADTAAEDAAASEPEQLDVNMLANAVTGHVGRSAEGQTPQGYDFYPASVWLNLEQPYLDQIESVRYYFYHRTFRNPMRPVSDSNVFLATWKGYGCIENAEVKVLLKSGEELAAPFNLCTIWDRFHPGAFRKDGSRGGTAPLSDSEDFDKKNGD
jgi:hypothetical protein